MPMMGSRTFLLTALAACLIVSCHGLPKTPKTTEEVVPETQAELDSDNNEQDSDNDKLGQMLTQIQSRPFDGSQTMYCACTEEQDQPTQSPTTQSPTQSPTYGGLGTSPWGKRRNGYGPYRQRSAEQRKGCKDNWCYVKGGTRCESATASGTYSGHGCLPPHDCGAFGTFQMASKSCDIASPTEAPTTEASANALRAWRAPKAPTPPTEAPTTEAPTPPTEAPTPPTEAPTPPPTEAKPLTISSGSCSLDTAANCAFSPNMAAGGRYYGNSQTCSITVVKSGRVSSTSFSTEKGFDKLTIAGQAFSGSQGPSNVHVTAGSTISWSSDGSIGSYGWGICLSEECVANCATCEGPGVHQCLTCTSHMKLNGAAPAQCIPGPTARQGFDDSCQYPKDNVCDEPTYCSAGTDATDCA